MRKVDGYKRLNYDLGLAIIINDDNVASNPNRLLLFSGELIQQEV